MHKLRRNRSHESHCAASWTHKPPCGFCRKGSQIKSNRHRPASAALRLQLLGLLLEGGGAAAGGGGGGREGEGAEGKGVAAPSLRPVYRFLHRDVVLDAWQEHGRDVALGRLAARLIVGVRAVAVQGLVLEDGLEGRRCRSCCCCCPLGRKEASTCYAEGPRWHCGCGRSKRARRTARLGCCPAEVSALHKGAAEHSYFPRFEYVPEGHCEQEVLDDVGEYVPLAHGAHSPEPAGAAVPLRHTVHPVEPMEEAVPALHWPHMLAEAAEKLPAGQSKQEPAIALE